jgi:hypothetical protein
MHSLLQVTKSVQESHGKLLKDCPNTAPAVCNIRPLSVPHSIISC